MGFSPMWPELKREDVSDISGYEAAGGAGAGSGLSLDTLDPEAFSFWAAQHISADADTKLRWLSCRWNEYACAHMSQEGRNVTIWRKIQAEAVNHRNAAP